MGTDPNESPHRSADAILNRIREALDLPSDAALARAMGTTRMQIRKWRVRDKRPYPECLQVAEERGLSLDWVLTGVGEMRRDDAGAAEPGAGTGVAIVSTMPEGLEGVSRRVEALLLLLASLDQRDREAVIADCFARAEAAQQIADLRQAVSEMAARYAVGSGGGGG